MKEEKLHYTAVVKRFKNEKFIEYGIIDFGNAVIKADDAITQCKAKYKKEGLTIELISVHYFDSEQDFEEYICRKNELGKIFKEKK